MRQLVPPPMRRALLLGFLLMRSVVAAWAQSAGTTPVYQVPLGQAAAYGLLSGGSLVARSAAGSPLPIQAVGSAGASGAIGPLVTATAGVFAQNSGTVPRALTDLQAAQAYCGQPRAQARSIAGQLAGRTLSHGVYAIGGSATLGQSSTLTIAGDTATVVIVNIAGDLTLEAGSRVALAGVLPRHVYWNVAGTLHVAGYVAFMGNALVAGDALVDGVQLGYAAILSSGNVALTNLSPSVGHNRFFAARGTAGSCANPGPPCSFSPAGSELVIDGSFEAVRCIPAGLGGLTIASGHADACFWYAATGTSSDYYHQQSTYRSTNSPIPDAGVPLNLYTHASNNVDYRVPALAQNSRAKTGKAYAGIVAQTSLPPGHTYYEYLYQEIAGGLQLNRRYYAEFSAHLAPASGQTVTKLGLLVEPNNTAPVYPLTGFYDPIPRTPTINGNPHYIHPKNPNPPSQTIADSLNWQRIGGVFNADAAVASASSLRIVIGSFGDATELIADGPSTGTEAYYFIDNVSLSPLTEAGPDVVLGRSCAGSPGPSSVTLGTDPMPDMVAATYLWTLPDGTLLATTPNLTVAPTQTTTYVLTVTINGQAYTSQATVTVNNVYTQNAAATYVAPPGIGPADLGLLGSITTIDASAAPYGGRVVFDGTYHVRGTVHLENGTFELRPGTTFLVDGASGLPYKAGSGDTDQTTLVVQNASLELSGATLRASCVGTQWGGVWLERRGIARTQARGALRCRIQDAKTGVNSRAGNEYYLADTDFWHNDCGLRELAADKRAVGGEGVQNCTFREGLYGIVLEEGDYDQYGRLYGGDYGAARFVGNDFADLTYMGISAIAGRAQFVGNQFRDCGVAAISTQGNLAAGPPELRANRIVVPAGRAARAGIFSISQSPLIQGNVIEGAPAPLKTTGNLRVGIEFLVSMESGGTDQVVRNTVRNLDMALTTTTNDYDGANITIKKNTFQNNAADLVFYPYGTVNHPFPSAPPVTATIRCNSFLNDVYSTVNDPIGIWLKDMAVIDQGLATSTGNGNEFQTNQWLSPPTGSPISLLNDNQASRRNYLNYTKLQTSNESVAIQGNGGGTVNVDNITNPAGACGGNPPGVNNRQAISPFEVIILDSLRMEKLVDSERIRLLLSLHSQLAKVEQVPFAEGWLAKPGSLSRNDQITIGLYLLRIYRQQRDVPNMSRIRNWFEQSNLIADAELTAYLQLAKATDQIGSFLPGLQQLAEVNRAILQKVALSGTTSARIACRLLRAYEATCSCVLPKEQEAADKQQVEKPEPYTPRLLAYPNPASSALHVPYQLPRDANSAELLVYDALGRLVLRQNLVSNREEVEISTSTWTKGLYHLVILTGKQVIGQQHIAIVGN